MSRSLFGRLSLLMVVLFLVASAILLKLADSNNENYSRLVQQSLHRDLAQRMIADNDLLKSGRIDQTALANTFHSLMLLGPAYEIYTLDRLGNILVYSAEPGQVRSTRVELAPIRRFLAGEGFPLLGDDPRDADRHEIFSVAPVLAADGSLRGYLYVILHSQQQTALERTFVWKGLQYQARNVALVALTLTVLMLVLLSLQLTRPLRALSLSMTRLREQGFREGYAMPAAALPGWASSEVLQIHRSFSELMQSLDAQFKHIQDEERLRRKLLSHITHDLKTPLAALRGYLETWQLLHAGAAGHDYIAVAQRNSAQLDILVDQLVELARLEGGVETLRVEPIAIAELAQDVLSKFALRAAQVGVTLQVSPRDPGLMVHADIGKMERILTNLIDNAIRHTPPGGSVSIELSRVPDSATLLVKVRDTGCGIAPDDIERIFEPNFRGNHGSEDSALHLGLGLAIVRRLLELHDTSVRAVSEPGAGSSFEFGIALATGWMSRPGTNAA